MTAISSAETHEKVKSSTSSIQFGKNGIQIANATITASHAATSVAQIPSVKANIKKKRPEVLPNIVNPQIITQVYKENAAKKNKIVLDHDVSALLKINLEADDKKEADALEGIKPYKHSDQAKTSKLQKAKSEAPSKDIVPKRSKQGKSRKNQDTSEQISQKNGKEKTEELVVIPLRRKLKSRKVSDIKKSIKFRQIRMNRLLFHLFWKTQKFASKT